MQIEKYMMMSRTEVQCFECPACDASPGNLCIGARGKKRISNHRERWIAAEQWITTGNTKFVSSLGSHSSAKLGEQ